MKRMEQTKDTKESNGIARLFKEQNESYFNIHLKVSAAGDNSDSATTQYKKFSDGELGSYFSLLHFLRHCVATNCAITTCFRLVPERPPCWIKPRRHNERVRHPEPASIAEISCIHKLLENATS
jgi:hypothetical protein